MMKKLHLFALACLGFFCALAQQAPKREMRGAWIATYANIDWPNRNQTPQQQKAAFLSIVNHHQATGINTLFIQVRSQCDALYPSAIEPWSADLTGLQGRAPSEPWDPMQFMIEECHKRGIEFHAWLNPYRAIANYNNINSFAPNHVAKQHPEWLITSGVLRTLDPGLPQVRDYIMTVIEDIVQRYDIDGIHFDDYFYPNAVYNDDATFAAHSRGFTDKADWRRDNVNLLIQRVHETVKSLKPWVKFGVSPSGIYRNSTNPEIGSATGGLQHYTTLFADSRKWLQEGWVDYIMPQVYWYIGQPGANYAVLIPWWNNNAYGRHIYIGQAGYKVNDPVQGAHWANPSQIPNQVRMNRSSDYPNIYGQAIYNTSSMRSATKLGFRDSLRLFFYQKPSLLPSMPWRDNTPPAAPSSLIAIKYGNDSVVLNWSRPAPALNEMDKAKRFVLYRSESGEIDLTQSENILAITPNDTTAFTDKTVTEGKTYYYTVTAIDRLHNESEAANVASTLPPVITCPANQEVVLGASCSAPLPDYSSLAAVDNNGAPIHHITITQSPAAGTLISGVGQTVVTLTASDAGGNASSCQFTVAATDKEAPVISDARVDRAVLNAPNHKMREVNVLYNAVDNCGSVVTSLTVTSNEPENGTGDGDTSPDWEVIDPHRVKLRAERSGSGEGRVYTITIHAEDASGNKSSETVTVTVPHNNGNINAAAKQMNRPGEKAKGLQVTVSPNPTAHQFMVVTRSDSHASISIRILNTAGKVIERKSNAAANGTYYFGSQYRPGVYYLEVVQGSKRQMLKMIKQK